MSRRLLLFSPLPPARSGIADYVADLLPHLCRQMEVVLVKLPDQEVEPALLERYPSIAWQEALEADGLALFQMGNNRLHSPVAEAAARRPGIVVLHDVVLHHFLLDRTVGQGDFDAYRRILEANHGWIGEAASLPVRWGAFGQAAQFFLPAHRRLLETQFGTIVHGTWARQIVEEEVPGHAVVTVPMPVPVPAEIDAAEVARFRQTLGLPAGGLLLGSFGFQTPMKRTDVAIRALARPELRDAHLVIAGEVSAYCRYEELAAQVGVEDRVHPLGYLPFHDLQVAIAASDVCLNLRYPSAGETSASLLRVLALGRAVVASSYAELGELPAELVHLVAPGADELDALAEAIARELEKSPERRAEDSSRRREYVRHRHDPGRVAGELVGAIQSLTEAAGAPVRHSLSVPPATSALRQRLRGRIEVEGLESLRPGERGEIVLRVSNLGQEIWLPSHEMPGGVLFETQLHFGGRDLRAGCPWLVLERALGPGETRSFRLELRRPLGEARLVIRPAVARDEGHLPILEWSWDRPW